CHTGDACGAAVLCAAAESAAAALGGVARARDPALAMGGPGGRCLRIRPAATAGTARPARDLYSEPPLARGAGRRLARAANGGCLHVLPGVVGELRLLRK